MKKNIHYVWLLLASLLLMASFSSCDDDKTENKLAGTWVVNSLATNNQTLNALLGQLLPQYPVPLNSFSLTFGEANSLTISYPTEEGLQSIPAAYAYDDNELALRFDQVVPIPFNACNIAELTDSKLVLTKTVPKNWVEMLVQLLAKELPDYDAYLQAILAEVKDDGLKIDVELIKSSK